MFNVSLTYAYYIAKYVDKVKEFTFLRLITVPFPDT